MTPASVLEGAKALVQRGWIKSLEAHTADGTSCCYDSPNAIAWSSASAILKAADGPCADGEQLWSGPLGLNAYVALAALWCGIVAGEDEDPVAVNNLATMTEGPLLIDWITAWEKKLDRRLDEVLRSFDTAIGFADAWTTMVEAEKARLLSPVLA